MPELPEVTTIVSQLKKEIVGQTIEDVVSINGYKTTPEIGQFKQRVIGQKVVDVRRIAKNIVIELQSLDPSTFAKATADRSGRTPQDDEGRKLFLVIHLAMTGRLLLRQIGQKEDPWTRLVFYLSNNTTPVMLNSFQHPGEKIPKQVRDDTDLARQLRFCDSRMFGFVRIMTQEELDEYSGKYGPDALDKNLTPEIFLTQVKKKRTEIKRALLEQELVAGAGNIYVNDSLWLAKIHPQTPTQDLTQAQSTSLLSALQQILEEGIAHRGSTLGDKMYIDVYGREGEHQNYFRVFGKENQPCPRCATIINYIDIGGRGTFFCPKCQVKPNLKTKKSLPDNGQIDLLSFP